MSFARSIVGLVGSLLLLVRNLHGLLTTDEEQLLTPVIPGINLPTSQFPYLALALLLNVCLHEAGHAIAAAADDMVINSVGFFFITFVPGGAYVDVKNLEMASMYRRLKVSAAGAWHNIWVFAFCLLAMAVLPVVLAPVYVLGEGAAVVHVNAAGPVAAHLHAGDVITAVNGCQVRSVGDWRECYLSVLRDERAGFCAPSSVVGELAANGEHCCQEEYRGVMQCMRTSAPMCTPGNDTAVDQTPRTVAAGFRQDAGVCSPVRPWLDGARCSTAAECSVDASSECATCLRPSFTRDVDRLVVVTFRHAPSERHGVVGAVDNDHLDDVLLYAGHPAQVWHDIDVIDYQPRMSLPLPLDLPRMIERFFMFTGSLATALALLNLAPVYKLDGEETTTCLLALLLPPARFPRLLPFVRESLLWFGTILLVANLVLSHVFLFI